MLDDTRKALFWAKVEKQANGCWYWTAYIDHGGYGTFRADRMRPAHVVSYMERFGPVPDRMQVDHTCHNNSGCVGGPACLHRRCVNPAHLEAVTARVNSHRSPFTTASRNAAKTHCKWGHEFTPENTLQAKAGRQCRTCKRRWKREWKERVRLSA